MIKMHAHALNFGGHGKADPRATQDPFVILIGIFLAKKTWILNLLKCLHAVNPIAFHRFYLESVQRDQNTAFSFQFWPLWYHRAKQLLTNKSGDPLLRLITKPCLV